MAGGLHAFRQPGSLKEATAELIKLCGGPDAVANLPTCRVERSQIQRYGSAAHDDRKQFMPIDIVLALEHHCGKPIVTRFLAASQSCAVIALHNIPSESYPLVLSKIGKETGELFAEATAALADGTISPGERGRVKREALGLMTACAALVSDLGGAT